MYTGFIAGRIDEETRFCLLFDRADGKIKLHWGRLRFQAVIPGSIASGRSVQHMANRKKLPVGIENFEDIRKQGFYYLDKTKLIE